MSNNFPIGFEVHATEEYDKPGTANLARKGGWEVIGSRGEPLAIIW